MPSFMKRSLAAAVAATLAGGALAQSYVSAGGQPVKSAHGLLWRTGQAKSEAAPKARPEPVTYSAQVLFAFDDDTLSGEARKELDALAEKLFAIEVDKVVAVGYADGTGSPQYNRRLAARRAKAVGDYLAGKGLAVERLQLVAIGEADPVTAGACEYARMHDRYDPRLIACLEPDRRVEIELVGRSKPGL
ncbi:MAG TPA: OmpA family protein [Burkholderiales bacterium]